MIVTVCLRTSSVNQNYTTKKIPLMQKKNLLFGICQEILPPVSVNATKPQNPGSVFSYTLCRQNCWMYKMFKISVSNQILLLRNLTPARVTQLNPGYKCRVLRVPNHCKWSTVRAVEMVSTMNLTIAATAAFFLISGKLSQTFIELMFSYSVKLSREKRLISLPKSRNFLS